jgi:hypothetical protein
MKRDADFSGFLGETMDLLGSGAVFWIAFVAVVGGLNALGIAFGLADPTADMFGIGIGASVSLEDGLATALFQIVVAVVTVVATYFLIAKLLEMRGLLPDPSTRIWAYVGLSILSTLGLILGFILLIVPGIILMVRWSAASGYLIGGREGIIDALGASWRATEGKSWPIFGAGLVLLVILIVAGGAIGAMGGIIDIPAVIGVISAAAEAFGSAVMVAFGVAIYALVRDDEAIGEVFA